MKTFRTSVIIFSIVIFFSISLEAQEIKIVGTGQTTGHIATITVTNNSNTPYLFKLGPAIIPTKEFKTESGLKKSQPQMHTGNINREIAPGETAEIPVTGFCLDVRKPALPAGEFFPPFDNWITAIPTSPEPVNPGSFSDILPGDTLPSGYIFQNINNTGLNNPVPIPEPLYPKKLTYPGTDKPFNYKIDISEHPEDAALVLFPMVNNIISTYDSLNNLDLISTPFSGNAEMQHDAVIQQTIWMATSILQGEPYSKEDFTKNMSTQFEESSGVKIEEAPDEQKKQFNQGIDQFWSTFELVGEKAKVINVENVTGNEPDLQCEHQVREEPGFQFDMKIADSWKDAEERRNIIREAQENIRGEGYWTPDTSFYQQDAGLTQHPTSAAVFFNQNVIGGFASAYARAFLRTANGETEWVGSTEPMTVNVNDSASVTMEVIPAPGWSSFVVGSSFVKLHASSSVFDAVAGNTQNGLNFLRVTKFAAKLSLQYLIECGTGKTTQSFADYAKDAIKDEFQSMAEDAVLNKITEMAEEYFGDISQEAGLTQDIIQNLTEPNLEVLLERLLGVDIPNLGEIIDEGLDATLNLFFVSNTYCSANGSLVVKIGTKNGGEMVHTRALYLRQKLEDNAVSGTGSDTKSFYVSDVQPNKITITTTGIASMMTQAKGNGSADAYIESTQIQVLVGVCKGPNRQYEYTTEIIIGCYKNDQENAPDISRGFIEGLIGNLNTKIEQELDYNSSEEDWKNVVDQYVRDLSTQNFAR